MYQAIVAPISALRPIPGRDKIQVATVAGHDVIVGIDHKVGDLGAFFPSDGQLSDEFCRAERLYRKDPDTGLPWEGYFEESRRVRTIKMAGQYSWGFWVPLDKLAWTGVAPETLTPGLTFTHLNGKLVCEKYYSRATRERIKTASQKVVRAKTTYDLNEHYDTPQLRYSIGSIPDGAKIYLTEKLHGTSGRTGRVPAHKVLTRFQVWFNTLMAWLFGANAPHFDTWDYAYVSGTRRVNLDPTEEVDKGYYSGTKFRKVIHDEIVKRGLRKGETLFYEIVGFDEKGQPIMPAHHYSPKDHKDAVKRYGTETVLYRYGAVQHLNTSGALQVIHTNPDGTRSYENVEILPETPDALQLAFNKMFKVFVYRITLQDEDGNVQELTWDQVKARCQELGLNHVPEMAGPVLLDMDADEETDRHIAVNRERLMELCRMYSDGPSTLDPSHTREGVCVVVESPTMHVSLKYKGWWFCELEGLRKNDDTYVDPEEIA